MALRPDEKRGILAALFEFQRGAGSGALAGMQRREQREDLLEHRAYSEADQMRRATMGLFGRGMWRDDKPITLDEQLGLIQAVGRGEDIEIPEGITTTPPIREREFAETDRALSFRREIESLEKIMNQTDRRMQSIVDEHGSMYNLEMRILADANKVKLDRAGRKELKANPVSASERRDFEEFTKLRMSLEEDRRKMADIYDKYRGYSLGYGESMGTPQPREAQEASRETEDLTSTTTERIKVIAPDVEGEWLIDGADIRKAFIEGYTILEPDKLSDEDYAWAVDNKYFLGGR